MTNLFSAVKELKSNESSVKVRPGIRSGAIKSELFIAGQRYKQYECRDV